MFNDIIYIYYWWLISTYSLTCSRSNWGICNDWGCWLDEGTVGMNTESSVWQGVSVDLLDEAFFLSIHAFNLTFSLYFWDGDFFFFFLLIVEVALSGSCIVRVSVLKPFLTSWQKFTFSEFQINSLWSVRSLPTRAWWVMLSSISFLCLNFGRHCSFIFVVWCFHFWPWGSQLILYTCWHHQHWKATEPSFQIKILFDYQVLSKYKLFFATAHQKCTLPSRAVQHLYSYTPVSIVFPWRNGLDLGKLQLLIIFLFWLKKKKCIHGLY